MFYLGVVWWIVVVVVGIIVIIDIGVFENLLNGWDNGVGVCVMEYIRVVG